MQVVIVFLAVSMITRWAVAHSSYKRLLPNADNIPDPCNRANKWEGIGHQEPTGGGPLTSFGRDFHNAKNKYTRAFCMKDSDGDNKTNGAELGDPNCVWTVGAVPSFTERRMLSHPGVCEPIGSPGCIEKNSLFLNCLGGSSDTKHSSDSNQSTPNTIISFIVLVIAALYCRYY